MPARSRVSTAKVLHGPARSRPISIVISRPFPPHAPSGVPRLPFAAVGAMGHRKSLAVNLMVATSQNGNSACDTG